MKTAKKTPAKKTTKKTAKKKAVKKPQVKAKVVKPINPKILLLPKKEASAQPKKSKHPIVGGYEYLIVPPSKRTISLSDKYGDLPKYNWFVQVPAMVFARRADLQKDLYSDHLAGVYVDGKCYHPPFPNMFGFSVCVPDRMPSVQTHANMFWQTMFGPQDDAIYGLLEWFGDERVYKELKKYDYPKQTSVNSSWLFEGTRDNLRTTANCLDRWEKISASPNALETLESLAAERLHGFPLDKMFRS